LKSFPPVPKIPEASESGGEEVKAVGRGLSELNAHAKHLSQLIDTVLNDGEIAATPQGRQRLAEFAKEASLTIKQHESALGQNWDRVKGGLTWCSRNKTTSEADSPCMLLRAALFRNKQLMVDGVTVEESGHFTDTPGKPGLSALGKLLGEFAERS
jgi:hypothetical protein